MDNKYFTEGIRPIMKKVTGAILFVILMIICAISLADIPLEAPYFTDAVFTEKVRIV